MCHIDVDRITNSVDSDQAAPRGLHCLFRIARPNNFFFLFMAQLIHVNGNANTVSIVFSGQLQAGRTRCYRPLTSNCCCPSLTIVWYFA